MQYHLDQAQGIRRTHLVLIYQYKYTYVSYCICYVPFSIEKYIRWSHSTRINWPATVVVDPPAAPQSHHRSLRCHQLHRILSSTKLNCRSLCRLSMTEHVQIQQQQRILCGVLKSNNSHNFTCALFSFSVGLSDRSPRGLIENYKQLLIGLMTLIRNSSERKQCSLWSAYNLSDLVLRWDE